MKHHKIWVERGRATCALVFVLGAQWSPPKPLTKAEVLSLVAAWPSAASTLHLIQQRGISFSPTEEYVAMLGRASGGRSGAALEESLRGAKASPSTEAEVSTETALLQHLTRCGELKNSQSAVPHSSEAEVECRAALSLAPDDPFVLLAVGTSLRQQQKGKEAAAVFKQALALDPSLVLGHVLLADALLAAGPAYRDERLVEGMAALRLDPNSDEAMILFAFLFGDAGVSDRDIATLRTEAHGHTNDPVPHFVLGLAYAESTESSHLQKAMTEFREAIRLDPCNGWYHYDLGGTLSDSGDKKAALAELETARKLGPDNEMFRNLYDYLAREVKK
jgi:predicted Zn-dependent protease